MGVRGLDGESSRARSMAPSCLDRLNSSLTLAGSPDRSHTAWLAEVTITARVTECSGCVC